MQLQHLQLLQRFADLHLQHLQHFWQSPPYMQGLWHRIAVPQLPQLPKLPQQNARAGEIEARDRPALLSLQWTWFFGSQIT
ncbi:MAG: hypothetical protein JNM70_13935 [Anaerolineae bacterium]|nr:hypothetical protein [Anaerolineae bacterium]